MSQRFGKERSIELFYRVIKPDLGRLITYDTLMNALGTKSRTYVNRWIYHLRRELFSDYHFAVVFNEGYIVIKKS